MTINFYLRFHTEAGQDIFILGNNNFLGNYEASAAIRMSYFNNDYWHIAVEFPEGFSDDILYTYYIKYSDNTEVYDGENNRCINTEDFNNSSLTVYDSWNATGDVNNVFFTSPFKHILLSPPAKVKSSFPKKFTHEFRVKSSLLQANEAICLCGSTDSLKNWNSENPILLIPKNDWFIARVTLKNTDWPAAYKYGIYDLEQKKIIRFEDGENRRLPKAENNGFITVLHDGFIRCPVVKWRGAGVAISVFSLRSKKSFGVGEFSDIELLVDWSQKNGIKLIQLLPVNDTTALHTWQDSYPYGAISAFALHPLYINLETVAGKAFPGIIKSLKKKQKQLNELPVLEYEQVMKFKLSALKEIFLAAKKSLKNDPAYFEFFELNRHWLVSYAAYSYLRDKYKTADFTKWKTHSIYNETEIQKLVSPNRSFYNDIAFFYFVQYHLHQQLERAVHYAHKNKIIVKGDIPIGIHRNGCDAWTHPALYNMNEQAGAPPDDFAVKGQNWGFPTYNWNKMNEDNFQWWRRRFDQMSNYFDAFRIDHILGFFRIWSIPFHSVEGIMGRFSPALPVHISEFYNNDIWFNYDRYCKPFITDEIIGSIFHEKHDFIKFHFLESMGGGQYQLKEDFNSQRKVEKYFNENTIEDSAKIKQGLFNLLSNIILIEDENSGREKFHFRIQVNNTSSFQQLEYFTKEKLYNLYINYFFRRQDEFWKSEALKKLPALKRSTNMLVCGEDLGMVPACVPQVMNDLGILSLEVERMPKDSGHDFFHPNDAPYLSVVTPSTHDMSTVRGWWEEDRNKTQRFYNYMLGHYGEAPFYCEPWINKEIIIQHLYSPAMWSIFMLQDLLGIDGDVRRQNPHGERINDPSNPHYYWSYRMHIYLEDLLEEDNLNQELKKYIAESGRS